MAIKRGVNLREWKGKKDAFKKLLEHFENIFPSMEKAPPGGILKSFFDRDLKGLAEAGYLDVYPMEEPINGSKKRATVNWYRLGPKGFITLAELRSRHREKIIMAISLIAIMISIIVSIGAVYFGFALNNPYQVRNTPRLDHIWIDEKIWAKWQLQSIGDQVYTIEVCFYNEGRSPTGLVNANWDSELVERDTIGILNIPGGETRCERITISWNRSMCEKFEDGARKMECNLTAVQNVVVIPMRIKCKFCDEERREFPVNFKFCFYDDVEPESCE